MTAAPARRRPGGDGRARLLRNLAVAAVAAALGVGVILLRDATLSTHREVAADSAMELVLRVSHHGGERGQTVEEMATALVLACRLEVSADPVGPLEPLGGDRYRVVVTPALDETDQRQLRGCLEDWVIDHVRADVESIRVLDRGPVG